MCVCLQTNKQTVLSLCPCKQAMCDSVQCTQSSQSTIWDLIARGAGEGAFECSDCCREGVVFESSGTGHCRPVMPSRGGEAGRSGELGGRDLRLFWQPVWHTALHSELLYKPIEDYISKKFYHWFIKGNIKINLTNVRLKLTCCWPVR